MADHYEMLFRLINKSIFHTEDLVEGIDWKAVSTELKHHSIYYIPADEIGCFGLSNAEKNKYMEALMRQAAVWNVVMYEQQAIVDRSKRRISLISSATRLRLSSSLRMSP